MKKTLVLLAVLALMATSAGATVIESFEDGNPSPWTGFAGVSTTVGVTDGTYSAYGDPLSWWNPTFMTNYSNEWAPLLDAGDTLTVDVTLVDAIPEGKWFQVWFQFLTDTGGSSGDVGYTAVAGGGATTTVSFNYGALPVDFANPGNWTQLRIGTNPGGGFDATAVYIDNIRVTPEPATLALLGMGGLALIRRRR